LRDRLLILVFVLVCELLPQLLEGVSYRLGRLVNELGRVLFIDLEVPGDPLQLGVNRPKLTDAADRRGLFDARQEEVAKHLASGEAALFSDAV